MVEIDCASKNAGFWYDGNSDDAVLASAAPNPRWRETLIELPRAKPETSPSERASSPAIEIAQLQAENEALRDKVACLIQQVESAVEESGL